MTRRRVVLDASALVDHLTGGQHSSWIESELSGVEVCAPEHLKAEVFATLGRQFRAGLLGDAAVDHALRLVASLQVTTHPVDGLMFGAWNRRHDVSLADALYVELADQLGTVVVTTDLRLARASSIAVAPPG